MERLWKLGYGIVGNMEGDVGKGAGKLRVIRCLMDYEWLNVEVDVGCTVLVAEECRKGCGSGRGRVRGGGDGCGGNGRGEIMRLGRAGGVGRCAGKGIRRGMRNGGKGCGKAYRKWHRGKRGKGIETGVGYGIVGNLEGCVGKGAGKLRVIRCMMDYEWLKVEVDIGCTVTRKGYAN